MSGMAAPKGAGPADSCGTSHGAAPVTVGVGASHGAAPAVACGPVCSMTCPTSLSWPRAMPACVSAFWNICAARRTCPRSVVWTSISMPWASAGVVACSTIHGSLKSLPAFRVMTTSDIDLPCVDESDHREALPLVIVLFVVDDEDIVIEGEVLVHLPEE